MKTVQFLDQVRGTVHTTGSCLWQSWTNPGKCITQCSPTMLASAESTAPWWGLTVLVVIGGAGMTLGELFHLTAPYEIGRTLADGGVFLLFGRGQQLYSAAKKKNGK